MFEWYSPATTSFCLSWFFCICDVMKGMRIRPSSRNFAACIYKCIGLHADTPFIAKLLSTFFKSFPSFFRHLALSCSNYSGINHRSYEFEFPWPEFGDFCGKGGKGGEGVNVKDRPEKGDNKKQRSFFPLLSPSYRYVEQRGLLILSCSTSRNLYVLFQ